MYISGEDSKRIREGLLAVATAITKKVLTDQLIYSLKLEADIDEEYFPEKTKEIAGKFLDACLKINKSQ